MAYHPHVLVEFGGQLAGDSQSNLDEIWACGVRCLDFNTSGMSDDPEALLGPIGDALSGWFTTDDGACANVASLRYLKINNILANGHYASATTNVREFPASTVGSMAQKAPAFMSVVSTWETGFQRGRAARGRIYLPNFVFTAAGSVISNADRDTVRDSGFKLLHNVIVLASAGASTEDQLNPGVFSKIDGSYRLITAVTADNIYDVQRRRKNQVKGLRSAESANPIAH